MRRTTAVIALAMLILSLIAAVGCQKAEQPPAQDTGGTATETGTTMEGHEGMMGGAGDSTHQMESGDMMQEETGEATGTN